MTSRDSIQNKNYEMLAKVAPKLKTLTKDILFDDVWERRELAKRDRSLITLAAIIAQENDRQFEFHMKFAIENGVTKEELAEAITHLAFYVGWPKAATAIQTLSSITSSKE